MYAIYGRVRYVNEEGICQGAAGGWLLPYFKAVDLNSDPSKWSNNVYDIDQISYGYYGFDIEDRNILGDGSSYKKGTDKFYIPFFWNKNDNNDKNKDSKNLTHIGFATHILARADDSELNVTISPIKPPKLIEFSMPLDKIKKGETTQMSEKSELDESFELLKTCDYLEDEAFPATDTVAQLNTFDAVEIFSNYKITKTVYNWGDGTIDEVQKTESTSSCSHTYNSGGTYEVSIEVFNGFNKSIKKTKSIEVLSESPIVDFIFSSENNFKGNNPVLFTNKTIDSNYTYDWIIEDIDINGIDKTVTLENKNKAFSPNIIFNSKGLKKIILKCHWNDGVKEQITEKIKTVEIFEFGGPTLKIKKESLTNFKGNIPVNFSNETSINSTSSFDWTIKDQTLDGTEQIISHIDTDKDFQFEIIFKSKGIKEITLKCNWFTGWETKEEIKIENLEILEFDKPIVNFISISTNGFKGNLPITFENKTNDNNNIYKWIINDVNLGGKDVIKTFESKDFSFKPVYTFLSSGNKSVVLECKWFTGWETKNELKIENLQIFEFDAPTIDFHYVSENNFKGNKIVEFFNDTFDFEDKQIDLHTYDWIIKDVDINENDTSVFYEEVNFNFTPDIIFKSKGIKEVTLKCHWDTGWETKTTEKIKSLEIFEFDTPIVDFISISTNGFKGNLSIIFENKTNDIEKINIYDWIINDTNLDNSDSTVSFISKDFSFKPENIYKSKGAKNITLKCYWFTGWETKIEQKIKGLEIFEFDSPIVDFISISANGFKGNEEVSFENKTSDIDDRYILNHTYDWIIKDSRDEEFLNRKFDYIPKYIFKSQGTKNITLRCHWFTGWEIKITQALKDILIKPFDEPVVDFTIKSDFDFYGPNEIQFENKTSDVNQNRLDSHIFEWTIKDFDIENNESNQIFENKKYNFNPSYNYKSPGNREIILKCYWFDGWNTYQKEKIKTILIKEYEIDFDFLWDKISQKRNDEVLFTSTISKNENKVEKIEWFIEDSYPKSTDELYIFNENEESIFGEGSKNNSMEIENNKTFIGNNIKTKFHSVKTKKIKNKISYNNGWITKEKEKEKDYTPIIKLTLDIILGISNISPVGRKENVKFENRSTNIDLQYYCDLIINDFYMIGNLDSPNKNKVVDNIKKYLKLDKSFIKLHTFQNISENDVKMIVYFDNGWGRVSKVISNKIKPIQLSEPNIDFNWLPNKPISRLVDVIFKDASDNLSNQHLWSSLEINDEFDIYNPDNSNYGQEVVNNNKKYSKLAINFEIKHKFQSSKDHILKYIFAYDDGFVEKQTTKEKTLKTTIDNSIRLDFTSSKIDNINPYDEIIYKNISLDINKIKNITWDFFDRDFITSNENKESIKKKPTEDAIYKWKYATRKPLFIENSALNELNKTVKMNVLFDNGWTNINESFVSKNYKINTNELIKFEINTKNLSVNESLDFYGKEQIEFGTSIEVSNNLAIKYLNWLFKDRDLENNDFEETFIEKSIEFKPIIVYKSAGDKDVFIKLFFDDGFSNIYEIDRENKIQLLKYLEPNFDFSWIEQIPYLHDIVKFEAFAAGDTKRPYSSIKKLKIDYYDNGTFDNVSLEEDFSEPYYSEIDFSNIWYYKFTKKQTINYIRVVGTWNDGWEDHEKNVIKIIELLLNPAKIKVSAENISNQKYKLFINILDNQGNDSLRYRIKLYMYHPIEEIEPCKDINDENSLYPICSIENNFREDLIELLDTDWMDENEKWVAIAASSKYKVIGSVTGDGGEAIDEVDFEIVSSGSSDDKYTIINCSKRCIAGIAKKYNFDIIGDDKKW